MAMVKRLLKRLENQSTNKSMQTNRLPPWSGNLKLAMPPLSRPLLLRAPRLAGAAPAASFSCCPSLPPAVGG